MELVDVAAVVNANVLPSPKNVFNTTYSLPDIAKLLIDILLLDAGAVEKVMVLAAVSTV